MKIISGFIFIVIGTLFVIKSEVIFNSFGRIDFFEKHLGSSGGSRLGYKLIGCFIIFLGILMMTGMIDGFIMFVLGPLVRVSGPVM